MKTIKQLSEELKISKEAIYKKMKHPLLKDSLKKHIVKLNNISHIDEIGEKIIISSLKRERQEAIQDILELESDLTEQTSEKEINDQPHITEYISILQEQVRTKDVQLEANNNHITQLIDQLGNNQLLFKTEQYKSVLQLQSEIAAAAMNQEIKYKPDPFWKRIFKR